MANLNITLEAIRERISNFSPKIGLILGSGLQSFADEIRKVATIPFHEIPGFSDTTVAGHKGMLVFGHLNEVPIVCLQGRAHFYEGNKNSAIHTPIRTLKLLGCEVLVLTNAAASLRQEVRPGSLVVINDHINFQFKNPLVGPNDDAMGPRFPSLQNAYDSHLREIVKESAHTLGIKLTEGIYLGTIGPSYETPAEIRAFQILGAEVVGMSTVPEVIVARHCDLKVVCVSTITNMGCGLSQEQLTHEGVLAVAHTATKDLTNLLQVAIGKIYATL